MSSTLLLGGARSGKSAFAVELGRAWSGDVTYVATAPPIDDDMRDRIRRHRDERPTTWTTVEEPVDLGEALAAVDRRATDDLVIVDCLTLWVSNLMWAGRSDQQIEDAALQVAQSCTRRPAPVVAISNEVGLGVHPETELGRRYRDVLGRVNQRWADAADRSLLMVAGRAIRLESAQDLAGDLT